MSLRKSDFSVLTAKKLFSDLSSYLQTRLSCTEQGYHDATQLVSMC